MIIAILNVDLVLLLQTYSINNRIVIKSMLVTICIWQLNKVLDNYNYLIICIIKVL